MKQSKVYLIFLPYFYILKIYIIIEYLLETEEENHQGMINDIDTNFFSPLCPSQYTSCF